MYCAPAPWAEFIVWRGETAKKERAGRKCPERLELLLLRGEGWDEVVKGTVRTNQTYLKSTSVQSLFCVFTPADSGIGEALSAKGLTRGSTVLPFS